MSLHAGVLGFLGNIEVVRLWDVQSSMLTVSVRGLYLVWGLGI